MLLVVLGACRGAPEARLLDSMLRPSASARRPAEPGLLRERAGTAASEEWKRRFSAPRLSVVAAARANPARVLYTSNEPGSFQLFGWDRETGEKRQLTNEPQGMRRGVLTPSGDAAVFLRDTGGNEQGVHVKVPFTGGEAAPLAADLPGDIGWGGVDFTPDGSVAFVGGSHREGYRIWRVAAGEPAQLLYRHANEAYSPTVSDDGALVAFIHSERKNDRHWTVRVARAEGAAAVADLTDGPETTVTHAAWSGARLLVNSNASGDARPSLWEPLSGARRALKLDGLQGAVRGVDFLDEGTLVLEHEHEGRTRLLAYFLDDDRYSLVPLPEGTVGTTLVLRDHTVLAGWSSGAEPPRVYEWSGHAVTKALEPSEPSPAGRPFRPVWIESSGGARFHAFLAEPPGPRPHPAIVYVHGGPASQVGDAFSPTMQAMVDHGYAVLAPNYRGSSGYGRAFTNVIEGDPGRLELDDLDAARRWLVAEGVAREDRIAVRGVSYGGYLTLLALTRQPERWWLGCSLAGIADLALMYEDAREALRGWLRRYLGGNPDERAPLYRERSPLTYVDALRAPLLIVHGSRDSRVPLRQMEAFIARLEALKKAHAVMIFEGGHATLRVEEQIAIEERFFAFALDHL
jgi:dipeptidyl aminopeptidase/acylaminoacyl peptidase